MELRSRWDMAVKHTSSQQLTPPPPKIHLPWGLSSGAGGKESKKPLGAQCLLRWHCRFLGTPHAIKGSFVPGCNRPQRHLSKGCVLNKKQHFPSWFLKVRLLSVMLQFMHCWQGNGTAAWGNNFFFLLFLSSVGTAVAPHMCTSSLPPGVESSLWHFQYP